MSRRHRLAIVASVAVLVAVLIIGYASPTSNQPAPAEELGPFPTADGDRVVVTPRVLP